MFLELATLGLLGLESDSFAERQAAQARLARNPLLALVAKPAGPESERAVRRALDPWIAVWLEVEAATFVEAMLDEAINNNCANDFVALIPTSLCFEKLEPAFVKMVYTQWAERRGWHGLARWSVGWKGPDWGADVMRHYWYVHHAKGEPESNPEDDPL